jgi:hypothetical protein
LAGTCFSLALLGVIVATWMSALGRDEADAR